MRTTATARREVELIDLSLDLDQPETEKEEDDDVVVTHTVLSPRAQKRARSSQVPQQAKRVKADDVDLGDGEDLAIVGSTGQVTLRDLPHARPDCAEHKFSGGEQQGCGPATNASHCPQCYCYVCDVKASECCAWGNGTSVSDHCHAHKTDEWKRQRSLVRQNGRPKGPAPAAAAARPCAAAPPPVVPAPMPVQQAAPRAVQAAAHPAVPPAFLQPRQHLLQAAAATAAAIQSSAAAPPQPAAVGPAAPAALHGALPCQGPQPVQAPVVRNAMVAAWAYIAYTQQQRQPPGAALTQALRQFAARGLVAPPSLAQPPPPPAATFAAGTAEAEGLSVLLEAVTGAPDADAGLRQRFELPLAAGEMLALAGRVGLLLAAARGELPLPLPAAAAAVVHGDTASAAAAPAAAYAIAKLLRARPEAAAVRRVVATGAVAPEVASWAAAAVVTQLCRMHGPAPPPGSEEASLWGRPGVPSPDGATSRCDKEVVQLCEELFKLMIDAGGTLEPAFVESLDASIAACKAAKEGLLQRMLVAPCPEAAAADTGMATLIDALLCVRHYPEPPPAPPPPPRGCLSCQRPMPAHEPHWKVRCYGCWRAWKGR